MLFTTLIEILKEIVRDGRLWTLVLGLAAAFLAASLMSLATPDSPSKNYSVGFVFLLGWFLGALAGLQVDKRRKGKTRPDDD